MKLEILGLQMNIWGIYCMVGAMCAVAAMYVVCIYQGMKKTSAPTLGISSLILGIICSRILYCLFVSITKERMPLSSWIRITDGGWSLFGMIGGVMLAAWISALIVGEKPKKMLDAASIALPLMIAAERMGEESLQSYFNETKDIFNLSRGVTSKGFLTIVNGGETYIATYRIDAFLAMILFLVLVFSLMNRKRREGDLWILFLLLCGAGGVLAESLRYDKFLEYSFVRIQQVLAAIMLASGVALAGKRERTRRKGTYFIALVTMVLTIAECIGLEFIIDRSEAVDSTIYSIFIGALTIPVIQGLTLMSTGKEEDGEAGENKLAAMTAAVTAISAAEVVSLLLEMGRIHYKDKFMLLALLPALAIMIIHSVAIRLAFRKNRPVIRSEE